MKLFVKKMLGDCNFLRNIAVHNKKDRNNSTPQKYNVMKRFLAWMMFGLAFSSAFAQRQMRDFIILLPDSFYDYLSTTKRTEMVDFYAMGVKAETQNLLSETTVLDSLTENYADIRLSERSRLQLGILTTTSGDTLLCAVRSFLGEASHATESEIAFYDIYWRPDTSVSRLSMNPSLLLHRPDTMSQVRYDELLRLIDPIMTSAVMAPDLSLTFSLSTPLLTQAEREELSAILLQRKLKWNGESFN